MLKLGFMAEEYRYISSRNHMLLGVGEGEQIFNNIGKKGENLTIAVLSMNRSSLTIRLMQSIAACLPDFAGEFLIGDNNSEPLEKQLLYRTMADMPYRCRMLEFDRNYGVAGGRNRLFAEVKTDWIFSLDNDIYFVKNPLLKVQADIARLGCHFLSMPLLNEENRQVFIHGGHLYVDDIGTGISIGGSSAYIENEIDTDAEYPPFLCSFVPGGASILYRQTFLDCGGYDEGMFVGFEDSEFSIRLFQKSPEFSQSPSLSITALKPG